MNQQIIQRLLKSIGYTNVSLVENGLKAVESIKRERFDLVLMDCMMPVVGGIEATEIVRREVPVEDQPPIVALTADAFKENSKNCLAAGMCAVLTKPINRNELKDTIIKYTTRM